MSINKLTKKKVVQIFSDGSLNFSYSIIKRSKKVQYSIKDNRNLGLFQKPSKGLSAKKTNFKFNYLR